MPEFQIVSDFKPTGDQPQAVDRLDGLIPPERVFVVTNKNLVQASRDAAPILPPENIVGEPMGRENPICDKKNYRKKKSGPSALIKN